MSGLPGDGGSGSPAVTEAAKSYLANQLKGQSSPTACFRLHFDEHQKMSATLSEAAGEDTLVRHGNRVVLAIEPDLAAKLRGSMIDVERTDDGREALIVL